MDESRVAVLIRMLPSLKKRLTELAKREHRSLNQQVEFLLERALSVDERVQAKNREPPKIIGRRRP